MSAIDTLKYSKFLPNIDIFFFKNRIILFYIFYTYYLKLRLTLFTTSSLENSKIHSIELLYKNSNWLEREVSEMFQINYILKKDNRNLLLDYSQNEHPMLKDFPTEGYKDLYYDFIEENLTYVDHHYIEL
jgi:NADH dehydrogenase (ubiquinone) Fe-S protein 3